MKPVASHPVSLRMNGLYLVYQVQLQAKAPSLSSLQFEPLRPITGQLHHICNQHIVPQPHAQTCVNGGLNSAALSGSPAACSTAALTPADAAD